MVCNPEFNQTFTHNNTGFINAAGDDKSEQVHVTLDSASMGPSTPAYDRRRLKTIVKDVLDAKYGGELQNIRPLEVTILHEVTTIARSIPIRWISANTLHELTYALVGCSNTMYLLATPYIES